MVNMNETLCNLAIDSAKIESANETTCSMMGNAATSPSVALVAVGCSAMQCPFVEIIHHNSSASTGEMSDESNRVGPSVTMFCCSSLYVALPSVHRTVADQSPGLPTMNSGSMSCRLLCRTGEPIRFVV